MFFFLNMLMEAYFLKSLEELLRPSRDGHQMRRSRRGRYDRALAVRQWLRGASALSRLRRDDFALDSNALGDPIRDPLDANKSSRQAAVSIQSGISWPRSLGLIILHRGRCICWSLHVRTKSRGHIRLGHPHLPKQTTEESPH